MPTPESRSTPAPMMSRAVLVKTFRTWSTVKAGLKDLSSAAMPAACGAAAEVPKNGAKPGTEVVTPSAAAMSGFCNTLPPVEETLPGVIAVPLAS